MLIKPTYYGKGQCDFCGANDVEVSSLPEITGVDYYPIYESYRICADCMSENYLEIEELIMTISRMELKTTILTLQERHRKTIKAAQKVWESITYKMPEQEVNIAKWILKEELQTLEILPKEVS